LKEPGSAVRIIHRELRVIHLFRELQRLADHEAADALSPELGRNRQVVDAKAIVGDRDRHHRDEVPDKPSEQTSCRNQKRAGGVAGEEGMHFAGVGGLDGTNEETLAAQRDTSP
jgi:hypothetical protein